MRDKVETVPSALLPSSLAAMIRRNGRNVNLPQTSKDTTTVRRQSNRRHPSPRKTIGYNPFRSVRKLSFNEYGRLALNVIVALLALIGAREVLRTMTGRAPVVSSSSTTTSPQVPKPASGLTSPERSSPEMVQLGVDLDRVSHVSPPKETTEKWVGLTEEWEGEVAVPMKEWQLPSNSPFACNLMHELDIERANSDLKFINCGGSRCAFQVKGCKAWHWSSRHQSEVSR